MPFALIAILTQFALIAFALYRYYASPMRSAWPASRGPVEVVGDGGPYRAALVARERPGAPPAIVRVASYLAFLVGAVGFLWSLVALWVWVADIDPRASGISEDLLGWGLLHMAVIGLVVSVQSLRSGASLLGGEPRALGLCDRTAGWSLGLGVIALVEVLGIVETHLPLRGVLGLTLVAFPLIATGVGVILQMATRALPAMPPQARERLF